MVGWEKANNPFLILFLEGHRSNSEYVWVVLNVRFLFGYVRDFFSDEDVLCLLMCITASSVQRSRRAGGDNMPHGTNGRPTQLSDALTTIPSKKLYPPAFSHVSGSSAGCVLSLNWGASQKCLNSSWASVSAERASARQLEKRPAQSARCKSFHWDSCNTRKHENLQITGRKK